MKSKKAPMKMKATSRGGKASMRAQRMGKKAKC